MLLPRLLVVGAIVASFAACESGGASAPEPTPPPPAGQTPAPPATGPSNPSPAPSTPPSGGDTVSENAPPKGGATGGSSSLQNAVETCDLPSNGTGFAGTQYLSFAGLSYSYELYVADKYDGHTRFPLVFVFHGDGMSGAEIRSWLSLEWEAGGNAIFVYPNGPGATWDTSSAVGVNTHVALVDAIVTDMEKRFCVDTSRIFAWGISRGAFFVNTLGCFRGNIFRGIFANSGGGPSSPDPRLYGANDYLECPTAAPAAIVIHGDADQTVGFGAGVESEQHWAMANGCDTTGTPIPVDPGPCVTYPGCKQPVIWCHLPGYPHKLWEPSEQAAWQLIDSTKPKTP
ncbi:alpha/beta hydrolase family esterase [Labilithrix luteola]|nr:hypothetical protein [Labilithrix luteola]